MDSHPANGARQRSEYAKLNCVLPPAKPHLLISSVFFQKICILKLPFGSFFSLFSKLDVSISCLITFLVLVFSFIFLVQLRLYFLLLIFTTAWHNFRLFLMLFVLIKSLSSTFLFDGILALPVTTGKQKLIKPKYCFWHIFLAGQLF